MQSISSNYDDFYGNSDANDTHNDAQQQQHSQSQSTQQQHTSAVSTRDTNYCLHKAIIDDNIEVFTELLRKNRDKINEKDIHGNTCLHLAVMSGKREFIQQLLSFGATVKCKNMDGWSPLAEAISYGDRQTIASLLRKLKEQSRSTMETRRPNLISALNRMQNFSMELKWDFQSWVPLVSRILPSDTCRIHKKGSNIRLDTTLVDFSDMKWERGAITFLFSGESKPSQSLIVIDNKLKVYQRVRYEDNDVELEDEVDLLMSADIVAAQMSTKSISFSRLQSGWLWREDKTESVGNFMADFYSIHGLCLESRKRREHLNDEDVQKNKAIIESLTRASSNNETTTQSEIMNGSSDQLATQRTVQRRKSLSPPPQRNVSWNQYVNTKAGHHPCLGRQPICKETVKAFKATVAMSSEFPMTVESLLNVLEVIAPFKHFNKLREFVQMKLPPGFPVKIDIPILPTVTARITFLKFQFDDDINDSLFEIPSDYNEDSNRFPDL